MCGISGIVNLKNQPVILDDIEKMNNQIIHRGPDGFGFYFGSNFIEHIKPVWDTADSFMFCCVKYLFCS